jgi:MFS family permease
MEAGFLVSLVQLAGMTLGLLIGLSADGIGLRRSMVTGLLMLGGISVVGAFAQTAHQLLVLRALEGVGFLLVSLPAPGLLRRLVTPVQLSPVLGLWGAYMPTGAAVALLTGPFIIEWSGWAGLWWVLGLFSFVMAASLLRLLAPDPKRPAKTAGAGTLQTGNLAWPDRLGGTLSARGPWLVALTFAMYSGQWLAVIGFLPSIYAQTGVDGAIAALLSALAAAVNMAGNIASGRLRHRGFKPRNLLITGFLAMSVGAVLAFGAADYVHPVPRYLAILAFSGVGGLIPGTLFSLAVEVAPSPDTVSTTVGWMQQWSSAGQFIGPPLVAWVAGLAGGWHLTWAVTGACSMVGLALTAGISRSGQRGPKI